MAMPKPRNWRTHGISNAAFGAVSLAVAGTAGLVTGCGSDETGGTWAINEVSAVADSMCGDRIFSAPDELVEARREALRVIYECLTTFVIFEHPGTLPRENMMELIANHESILALDPLPAGTVAYRGGFSISDLSREDVIMFEPCPDEDGVRLVLLGDGSVKQMSNLPQ